MKNQKKFFLLAGIFVVILLLAVVAYRWLSEQYIPEVSVAEKPAADEPQEDAELNPEVQEEPESEELEVIAAPDFTVLDGDGNEVSLSDYAGMPMVLNFWATWCGPCKSELPAFHDLHAEYGEEVAFMMINMTDGTRETMDGVKAFLKENGYTFPVYYDTELRAAMTYGASSIPLTIFVFADGTLAGGYRGAITAEMLENGIQVILAEASE